MENVVNVFVHADLEDRIACVSRVKMCDAETARKLIERKEEERAAYYNYYTGKRWGDSRSFYRHSIVESYAISSSKNMDRVNGICALGEHFQKV